MFILYKVLNCILKVLRGWIVLKKQLLCWLKTVGDDFSLFRYIVDVCEVMKAKLYG